jgi:hypothetical protein
MAKFKRRQLRDAYRFRGFVPSAAVRGIFGDPKARVVSLRRRRKKQPAASLVVGGAVTLADAAPPSPLDFSLWWSCRQGLASRAV